MREVGQVVELLKKLSGRARAKEVQGYCSMVESAQKVDLLK
jgi:hypothetical protein